MYQKVNYGGGGNGEDNIAFGAVRYITQSSTSYTVDIFEGEKLIENTFNYTSVGQITENNHSVRL